MMEFHHNMMQFHDSMMEFINLFFKMFILGGHEPCKNQYFLKIASSLVVWSISDLLGFFFWDGVLEVRKSSTTISWENLRSSQFNGSLYMVQSFFSKPFNKTVQCVCDAKFAPFFDSKVSASFEKNHGVWANFCDLVRGIAPNCP